MSRDPFVVLGLSATASADDVRRARRELAKRAHPDVGGNPADMRAINDAAAAALRQIAEQRRHRAPGDGVPGDGVPAAPGRPDTGDGVGGHPWGEAEPHRRDAPSFTVEALPVETFEALLLAAAALGEVEDDDPPYALHVLMAPPFGCWCHLAVVPDAGASTVSLLVAGEPGRLPPPVDVVRDAWIGELNALDWAELT